MILNINKIHGEVLQQALKLYDEMWRCNLKEINNHPAFKNRKYDVSFVNEKWNELEVLLKCKTGVTNEAVYDRVRFEEERKQKLKELSEMEFSTDIEVDELTLSLMEGATELYGRIGMGQLLDVYWHPVFMEKKVNGFDVEEVIYQIRQSVFDDLYGRGHSYGIRNESTVEESKVAFDIYQVVRRKLAFMRKPEGDVWNVAFDTPRQYSQQPLPEIKENIAL